MMAPPGDELRIPDQICNLVIAIARWGSIGGTRFRSGGVHLRKLSDHVIYCGSSNRTARQNGHSKKWNLDIDLSYYQEYANTIADGIFKLAQKNTYRSRLISIHVYTNEIRVIQKKITGRSHAPCVFHLNSFV